MKNVCVIGSGPTGVSVAHSLLEAGAEVTMFDMGRTLEPSMARFTRRSSLIDPDEFLDAVHARRKQARQEMASLPDKLPFGSTFAYQETARTSLEFAGKARFVTSLALGGLSNSWGANINRCAQGDIEDWPLRAEDLDPYFDRIQAFVAVSGEADAVDQLYRSPLTGQLNYVLSPQGQYILDTAEPHREALERAGIALGRSKLAIGTHHASHPDGCVGCGLCMHGCPYNAIFNAADVVEHELKSHPRFTYQDQVLAETFVEQADGVEVRYHDHASDSASRRRFDKLYIAMGAVGSTAMVARSLDWLDHTFIIKDSQKYTFGFLQNRRTRGVIRDRKSELSQIYLQTAALPSSSRIAHVQLYGYNDLLLEPFRKRLGKTLAGLLPKLGGFLLERLMVGFVYLHSDDSGHLEFDVAPLGARSVGLGRVRGVSNAHSAVVKDELLDLMRRHKVQIGGAPLKRLLLTNLPGNSQHFGCSLPMTDDPAPYTTDPLGRPFGCQQVHVVDCSVLPSITGTPPTLTAMANAARIGEQSLRS